MRHVVFLLLLVATSSAAHAALPYCDAPPTQLHRVVCTAGDGNLTRRAEWLIDLVARTEKALPERARKLDAEVRGFFDQASRRCLTKKKGTIPCVYEAFDRKLVDLSTRLIGTREGAVPGRYRYTESKAVTGELVFLRDEDGGASLQLDTVVSEGTRVCALVAEGMQVAPAGFVWSAEAQPACRIAVNAGKREDQLTIEATAECEAFFCGNGAIFTGTWTIRK